MNTTTTQPKGVPASACSELDDYSTDDLLERLPSNLHLARNENAPEHDRWRMYNSATDEYIAPGHSTARAAMIHLITRQEKERREWVTPNGQQPIMSMTEEDDDLASAAPSGSQPGITLCPDCGSGDFWHEWTDQHKVLRTVCCGELYRVEAGNELVKLNPEDNES